MELTVRNWGKTKFDETVKLYTLKNDFLEVEILNYGGIIRKISFPDKIVYLLLSLLYHFNPF